MASITINVPNKRANFVALDRKKKTVAWGMTVKSLQNKLKKMRISTNSVSFMWVPKPGKRYVFCQAA